MKTTRILTFVALIASITIFKFNAMAAGSLFIPKRSADGRPYYMPYNDAIQSCANNGAHLISIRELIQLLISSGAKGVVQTCYLDQQCGKINAMNSDGSSDEFYFSSSGYRAPNDDLANNDFWSTGSFYPYLSFALMGRYGISAIGSADGTHAALCVRDH